MTYPTNTSGGFDRGGRTDSQNTTSDYGAASADTDRAHGLPDRWTGALLDKLGGVPAKATRPGSDRNDASY